MGIVSKYFSLTPFERQIAWQAVGAQVWVRIGFHMGAFRKWEKFDSPPEIDPRPTTNDRLDVAFSIARTQAAVERHLFFKPNCLEHSLVLAWLLRRHGVPAVIRLGGRKESDSFEAHAWVEVGDLAFELGELRTQFAPFGQPIGPAENQTP